MAEPRHPEQVSGLLRLMHLATIQKMARELPQYSCLAYDLNSDAKYITNPGTILSSSFNVLVVGVSKPQLFLKMFLHYPHST